MNSVIYMAPMEGLTDYTFRNAYEETFGKGRVAKYFIPFISPNSSERFLAKEIRDIDRRNNSSLTAVPQVMANEPQDFIWTARMLYEEFGYEEINLNAGCPSGTVVSKSKGAGMLKDTEKLDEFLYNVMSDSFINSHNIRVSVKSRIGMENEDEFGEILSVYNKYSLCELILHPRVRTDYYKNHIHKESVRLAIKESKNKLVFNGDIFTRKSFVNLCMEFPKLDTFMLGRGLVCDPGLISVITSDNPACYERDLEQDKLLMKDLHDYTLRNRLMIMSADNHAIHRMKEMWCYMEYAFEDCKKEIKAIKKSQRLVDYKIAVDTFFNRTRLSEKDLITFSKKF